MIIEKMERAQISGERDETVKTDEIPTQKVESKNQIQTVEITSQNDLDFSDFQTVGRSRQRGKGSSKEHHRNKSLKKDFRSSTRVDDCKRTMRDRAKSCNPKSFFSEAKYSSQISKNERRVKFDDNIQQIDTPNLVQGISSTIKDMESVKIQVFQSQ